MRGEIQRVPVVVDAKNMGSFDFVRLSPHFARDDRSVEEQ
jgi:hypothetical protein